MRTSTVRAMPFSDSRRTTSGVSRQNSASAGAGSTPRGSCARYSASAITRPSARSFGPTRDGGGERDPVQRDAVERRSSSSGVKVVEQPHVHDLAQRRDPQPQRGTEREVRLGVEPDRVINLQPRAPEDARQVAHQIEVPQVSDAPQLRVAQPVAVRLALRDARRWPRRDLAPAVAAAAGRAATHRRSRRAGPVQAFMRRRKKSRSPFIASRSHAMPQS